MQIHEFYINKLKYHTPTEYYAYSLLKKNPIKNNVNYLVVPWCSLLKEGEFKKEIDIRLDGGFTVCQKRRYELIIPLLKEIGIDTLFATHAKNGKSYEGITVLPFPHYAVNSMRPAKNKDILYSFIGSNTYRLIRSKIFRLKVLSSCVIEEKPRHKVKQLYSDNDRQRYKNILSRSRYSLCPRGMGPNTIRFWESLQAGAIPILISDSMSLPDGIDWDTCIIRIPEEEFTRNPEKINEIVLGILPKKEEILRRNCYIAYEKYSGENFVSCIRQYYEK